MNSTSPTRPEATASRGIQRSHDGWLRLLDPCLMFAERPEVCEARTPDISAWSVGQQLEHLLLADRGILQAIQELADPTVDHCGAAEMGGPTLLGRLILWIGFVPRGRGQAPDFTTPAGMSPADLAAGLGEVRTGVEALGPRLGEIERIRAVRAHPALGAFNPSQWIRFAFVHHVHHAKIIRDILKEPAAE